MASTLWCAVKDLNFRAFYRTDLQSVAFDHSSQLHTLTSTSVAVEKSGGGERNQTPCLATGGLQPPGNISRLFTSSYIVVVTFHAFLLSSYQGWYGNGESNSRTHRPKRCAIPLGDSRTNCSLRARGG